ncbi:hypothetical protein T11_3617, partial [Trichinella zimbabwensis]
LFLKESISYDGTRYVEELPWINNRKMLPDNFEHAVARLQQTERTMLRDPDVATAYKQTLKEYLDSSIIEEKLKNLVSTTPDGGKKRQI